MAGKPYVAGSLTGVGSIEAGDGLPTELLELDRGGVDGLDSISWAWYRGARVSMTIDGLG